MVVVAGHICDFSNPEARQWWMRLGNIVHPYAAVIGFLLISGYSMAHSIRSPKGFYLRRTNRILPVYITGLLLGLLVIILAHGKIVMPGGLVVETPSAVDFLANLFFLQGWVVLRLLINGPLWSLSIEIFYYVLTPLFNKIRPPFIVALILTSIVFYWLHPTFPAFVLHGQAMVVLAWSWLIGFYWYKFQDPWGRTFLFGACCGFSSLICPGLGTTTIVFSAFILMNAEHFQVPKPCIKLLDYLGELSYPLYALHWPTILGVYALTGVKLPIVWLAATLVMTVVVYHTIDRRFRFRKHAVSIAGNAPSVAVG